MVKIIVRDSRPDRSTNATCVNFGDLRHWPFRKPQPLGSDFPTPIIAYERGEVPVDFFSVGSTTIISNRCRKHFEKLGVAMEYIPISLRNMNGRVYPGGDFFFAHLLTEIDCFDYEKSKFSTRFSEKTKQTYVEKISKLVLHDEAIGQKPIFAIQNISFSSWLISDECVRLTESTDLLGMNFMDIDAYIKKYS